MKHVALALALVSAACSAYGPAPEAEALAAAAVVAPSKLSGVTLCVSRHVLTTYAAEVHGAASDWAGALGMPIVAVEYDHGVACDVLVDEITGECDPGFAACAYAVRPGVDTGYVMLVPGEWNRNNIGRVVLSHELGHAFGAHHVEEGLMQPVLSWRTPSCPDASAVAGVVEAGLLDVGAVSPCE